MKNLNTYLERYAKLAVEVGVNLKEKEGFIITTNVDGLELTRFIAKEAYKAGAKHVEVQLSDDDLTLIRYKYGKDFIFEEFPKWKIDEFDALYNDDYHHIFVIAPDPELLKDIDPKKVNLNQKTASEAMSPIMKYRMTGFTKWSIVAVPSLAWAKSVFPDKEDTDAIDSLWNEIIKACRLDYEDPVKAWKNHDNSLKTYMNFLNENNFSKLKLEGPGTDLEVYLAEDHIWIGGSNDSLEGVPYMANIPTEEVFTAPHAFKVNGKLKATKPLSVNGKLVDDFGFTFKDGVVVDFYAEKGYETLKDLMKNDEGSKRLGEVALVQDDSPISNTGILFNNTLFDENASVHFALGRAYGFNIKNGSKMTNDELLEKGANYSLIHVDFMVGGENLNIFAFKPGGEKIQLFKDGNWII
ncbi:MAG: aminopeptidase [Clostridium sp.]|nr:aminopeptidase [Clostridium sp.]